MTDVMTGVRRAFLRGILLLLPLAITFLIMRWLFSAVTVMTGSGARTLLRALGAPEGPLFPALTGVFALALTVGIILLVGLVGGNYLGRRAWSLFERMLLSVPLVRWFYGSTRQLMDAFAAPGSGAFKEVVMVEYPRHGIWTVGFVTSTVGAFSPAHQGKDLVCVFLPTTPNPTSGYMVIVPRSAAVPTSLSIDEGLKLIVSGGFLVPRDTVLAANALGSGAHPARP
ncbi:MAG: DUF502 domain-containing protein [Candidatus Polarisedimenticolia bacterium]